MDIFTDFISRFGTLLIDVALWPLLLWTIAGGLLLFFLNRSEQITPDYQYYLRLSLIFSLPAGIIGAVLSDYMAGFLSTPGTGKFFVIQNPIEFTATGEASVSHITQPEFWIGTAGLIVAGISVIRLLLITADYLRLSRWTRTLEFTTLYNDDLNIPLQEFNQNSPLPKHVLLACSPRTLIPFTYGWLQPRIVIPSALKTQPQKLQIALRHELQHIKNHDFMLNNIAHIISALFWFHPLITYLRKSAHEYSEILCDAEVLAENHPLSRKHYASLLFEFATKAPETSLAIHMASPKSSLKKRVAMLAKKQHNLNMRNSLFISFISASLLILAFSCTDIANDGITSSEIVDMQTKVTTSNNTQGDHPLYIINGEEMDMNKPLARIKPEYIKSIRVLKGENALLEYGDKGRFGVVMIEISNLEAGMNDLRNPDEIGNAHNEEDFYISVDKHPKLKGGLIELQKEITYPESARQNGEEGRVIVQFIINEEGEVENPKAIRGISQALDNEAIRVVKTAKFEPGMQNGEPVRVRMDIPINFKLNNNQ